MEWLVAQKTSDTIESVTEEILSLLVAAEPYLAVFFSGPCAKDDQCHDILEQLEDIDAVVQR